MRKKEETDLKLSRYLNRAMARSFYDTRSMPPFFPYTYVGLYQNKGGVGAAKLCDVKEPASNGYKRIKLSHEKWKVLKHGGLFYSVPVRFTVSGSSWGYVRGYFVCTVPRAKKSGHLLLSEHFQQPGHNRGFWLRRVGDQLVIHLKITTEG